jgi:hypothetical protein
MKACDKTYHIYDDACAQAFLKKIGVSPRKFRSPQTAFVSGLREIIQDEQLLREFNTLVLQTQLGLDGFEIYQAALKLKTPRVII